MFSWFKPYYFSIALILLITFLGYQWLNQDVEETGLEILSSYDVPENGLPVFAQFDVTQTFALDDVENVSKILIPIYKPGSDNELKIDLRRDDKLLYRWRYNKSDNKVVIAELPLVPSLLLSGSLELNFSAREVAYKERDKAPRIFIEKDDTAYLGGHYRVAQNDKKGDVGLRFISVHKRWDDITGDWRGKPLIWVSKIGIVILLLIVIAMIPIVLLDFIFSVIRWARGNSLN